MQEEVENRTVSLIISGSKFSGRLLKAGISKYLAHRKETKTQKSRDHPVEHGGRVSMAELQAQKGDLRRLDISDPSIKEFERIARQHEVKYSVYKVGKGKYCLTTNMKNTPKNFTNTLFSLQFQQVVHITQMVSLLVMIQLLST
ncbi:MAG: PcfB family protein [Clostridiaceae bacterium]|nr:PcfB family protein [Clostridiaceae bacterium]